jgi:hypothetical protein
MKEPKPWLSDQSTPEEIRVLFSAAEPLPAFDGARRTAALQVAEQLAAHGAVAHLAGGVLSTKVALVVLGVGVCTAVGVGVKIATTHDPPSAVSARASAPAPVRSLPPGLRPRAPSAAAVAQPLAAERASQGASQVAASADSARRPSGMADEAVLLERARRLLVTSPARALGVADEHAATYPRGQLGAERELIAIEALVRLRRPLEARHRADTLLANDPGGLYTRRVRELLPAGPAEPRVPAAGP